MKKTLLSLALAASSLLPLTTQAADVTLRFAHFFPPVATQSKDIFQAWADKVKEESDGRIAVELYPASTLAKPPALYDAVRDRIADMTATVPGYTANRFPLTQIVELPGIVKNAAHGSCVLQGLYESGALDKEYRETRPLFLFTHGQGHLHTTEKLVKSPGDLKGLRIRRPSPVVATLLEGLGAQPVGMPAPEAYESVQKGVIDGVSLPWEGQLVFRINELTPKHTEVGGLYTLAFVVTMNKDVYEGLPDDLKKVIDDNSGKAWAELSGKVFDELDAKGREQAVAAGHEIHTVEGGAENPEWKPILDQATESYLAELEGKGLPARDVYQRVQELAASCSE
ncbi:MAG: TRAP transporter substrate-binding protein [Thiothrix sp.]|nr:TRAP transporter substrate-binding protein [Thiothrix sp.]